jgi:acetylornithine/N-succinyldiaminopimelate aminotransferase
MSTLTDRWQAVMMNNYGTPPIGLVRGSGTRVWDEDGNEYLDMLAGIAVNALGHAHPRMVQAITDQAATLGHTSNFAATEPGIALAERLITLADHASPGRVFFCNSGAEANEAAFKMSRLTVRTHVVVATGSFHGRTMGALALTAQPAKQDPFRPLPGEVTVIPFDDIEALRAAVTTDTAAVFLEPIQGEGGVIAPHDGYLTAARDICTEHGALLVLDEVQTGVGRTGTWFAYQHEQVQPDIVTMAKGLAGGLPIGAVLAFGAAADLLQPGSHGSTFGGNPYSAAAAHAVLAVLHEDDILTNVRERSDQIQTGLAERSEVAYIRGRGLLLGVVLNETAAKDMETTLRTHGVLANAVSEQVIRLAPPLILSRHDVDDFLDRWAKASAEVAT